MIRTLYGKLALVLVLLLVVLGIGFTVSSIYSTKIILQEVTQRFNRNLARNLLVQQNYISDQPLKDEEIKSLFSHYMHINPNIEIYLLDTKGNILAFEAPQAKLARYKIDLAPIKTFLTNDMMYPVLGDDPRHPQRQKIFSAAGYPFEGEPMQYLYVVLGGEDYDSVMGLYNESYFLQVTTRAVIITVVFGLLVGLVLFHLLTRRLFRLSENMESFTRSDFQSQTPFKIKTHNKKLDEIDHLGSTYNSMSDRIIELMQSLKDNDELRRNLIANVSHDLRTPLASLQGYIETLLIKTGIYTVEQRKHYLGIALKQSQRLTKLVEELFELSQLDANETPPNFEPVSFGELVMDVIQQYRLRAEKANLTITYTIPEQLPFVRADIAMLERVLENLFGNALKHTPEGGQIDCAVQYDMDLEHKAIRIQLCNTGTPIGPGQIDHVFERFYQVPENREHQGAGLGLAIVKRIIELHESEISISSTSEHGTCIAFSLPQWKNNNNTNQ